MKKLIPIFRTGRIALDEDVVTLCLTHSVNPDDLLSRHTAGDFGDVSEDDAIANRNAIESGNNEVCSIFRIGQETVSIITTGDRSFTLICANLARHQQPRGTRHED